MIILCNTQIFLPSRIPASCGVAPHTLKGKMTWPGRSTATPTLNPEYFDKRWKKLQKRGSVLEFSPITKPKAQHLGLFFTTDMGLPFLWIRIELTVQVTIMMLLTRKTLQVLISGESVASDTLYYGRGISRRSNTDQLLAVYVLSQVATTSRRGAKGVKSEWS